MMQKSMEATLVVDLDGKRNKYSSSDNNADSHGNGIIVVSIMIHNKIDASFKLTK